MYTTLIIKYSYKHAPEVNLLGPSRITIDSTFLDPLENDNPFNEYLESFGTKELDERAIQKNLLRIHYQKHLLDLMVKSSLEESSFTTNDGQYDLEEYHLYLLRYYSAIEDISHRDSTITSMAKAYVHFAFPHVNPDNILIQETYLVSDSDTLNCITL